MTIGAPVTGSPIREVDDSRIPDYVVIGEHRGQVTAGSMVDVSLITDSATGRAMLSPEANKPETFVIDSSCTKPGFKCQLSGEDRDGRAVDLEIRAISNTMASIYLFETVKGQTPGQLFPRGGLRLDSVGRGEWRGDWRGSPLTLHFDSNRVTGELVSDEFDQLRTQRCSWRN